ncbi:MAG: carbohydrate ABC transporter permease, partial [Bacillota bacterium]
GGSGWFGRFVPGAVVPFEVTYEVPQQLAARDLALPKVQVPRRVPGAGAGAVRISPFAADFAEVSPVELVSRKAGADGTEIVTYRFTVRHAGGEAVERLPVDVEVPKGYRFVGATLWPNRIERLGRVQSWNSITPGVIPYVFYNYTRVFRENYSRTTGRNLFLTWIGNSLFVSTVKVLTTLVFSSTAGYALARLRFAGRHFIFVAMLFSMMVPSQVTFISNYLVLRDGIFGLSKLWRMPTLLNTFTGLILSGLVGASAVFIMKQFFESLPKELEESARIDGASPAVAFRRVILPLARPALGAVTILTFQGAWNDFFWPLVVLTSPQDKFTLMVGLSTFRRAYGAVAFDWGPLLAGAIVAALPVVILFVVFQRYFVEGISFTGLKG